MIIHRTFRYRLAPTPAQIEMFGRVSGVCRFIYNLAFEQRRDFWRQYLRQEGRHLSYFSQCAELTQLRKEVDWIAAIPRDPQERALEDLDRAYKAFFRGGCAYPTPRRRSSGCGFSYKGCYVRVERLNAKWSEARIGALGWFKFRNTRPHLGDIKIASVRQDAGEWYLNLACAIEVAEVRPPSLSVGIDRGVTNTLALSTGELLKLPESIVAHQRRRQQAQKVLSRRVKGSKRRNKQRARVARLWGRERRARADWLHRASTRISRRFGLVAIEALNISAMTASAAGTIGEPGTGVARKRGLNRSIRAQGWGIFERMLAYKLEATGGALIRVPAAHSSQTCQSCGTVDHRSRESQAVFRCVHCGHEDHADINAAKEILRRSTSGLLVEGARQRPIEARTMGVAA